ncbi:DoxX family protein [Prosthecobacter dejongeii]|uniref:Putative membrane protein n=1 Tax=Prosthecobacter dejongeii TaxID=48465 RepID=A0A7W7YLF7_9BACT|nr:DoxX family membrane protein [Prosthecobacter dejongeii]MBB5038401.1 putative membrane protein [Prosthecobacter dejongeii]
MNRVSLKTLFRLLLGLFFIAAGVNHFLNPQVYVGMIPPYLPYPEVLNLVSGVAEVAGGVGILMPRFRRWAGWGLLALLVAIFPANLHLALNGWAAYDIPRWVLWARLPLQGVFIAWVYWTCLAKEWRDLPGGKTS